MAASLTTIKEYFENIATQLIEIGHTEEKPHFYRLDYSELLGSLEDINYPALVLEDYEGKFTGGNSDSMSDIKNVGFSILFSVQIDDTTAKMSAYDDAENIIKKIVARMLYDRSIQHELMIGLNFSTIKYTRIGPVHDHSYGIFVEFEVTNPNNLAIDVNDWLDLL